MSYPSDQFEQWVKTDKGTRAMERVIADAMGVSRQRLRDKLDDGTRCPCCDQNAKRYQRKLNSSMAAALCWMWSHARDLWIEVPQVAPAWVLKAREYPKLEMWGLIESKPKEQGQKGRTSGIWRITALGAQFVRGCCDVPRYAYVYNGNVDDMSQARTDIRAALGDRFDYAELMRFEP